MTKLEKAGTVAIAYALMFGWLEGYPTRYFAHSALFLGTIMFLFGDSIREWLKDKFPHISW